MIEMIVENSFDILIFFCEFFYLTIFYLAIQEYAKKLDTVMTQFLLYILWLSYHFLIRNLSKINQQTNNFTNVFGLKSQIKFRRE